MEISLRNNLHIFFLLGAGLEQMYEESDVVVVGTLVNILDVLFIKFLVQNSLARFWYQKYDEKYNKDGHYGCHGHKTTDS